MKDRKIRKALRKIMECDNYKKYETLSPKQKAIARDKILNTMKSYNKAY
jgi:hypothetical protein